jgi:putative hydrolase of the HAD superfamily
MRIRAVIFDIYNTLLEKGPPPADAEQQWSALWQSKFGTNPRISLEEFAKECGRIITREHDAARAIGVKYPEMFWPQIMAEACPELVALPKEVREEFVFQHTRLRHTIRMMPGAAAALRAFSSDGLLLGLASNAQPYTLRELKQTLSEAGLDLDLFDPALTVFSFQIGFSKPDPHFFRLLTARLRVMGVQASETMMIGNSPENDVIPARAQGWQIWHLTAEGIVPNKQMGLWPDVAKWVRESGSRDLPLSSVRRERQT